MAGWCSWLFVAALVAVCLEGSDAEKCTGQSAKLNSNDCAGWIDFFDAAGGSTWDECSTARTDPCSCNSMAHANISCGCTHRIFQPPCTPTIQAVTLSGVGLKGVITGAWGALSTLYGLRELDLSSNKLSGQLPNTFVYPDPTRISLSPCVSLSLDPPNAACVAFACCGACCYK